MARYGDLDQLLKDMEYITNDETCPLHIAAEIEQTISLAPAADVAPKSQIVKEIFEEMDSKLIELAMEFAKEGRFTNFSLCEVVHNKVLKAVAEKYVQISTEERR